MARECRRAWGDLRPGKVLLSSTVPSADDDDDDANYVPPPDEVASVPSDGEVEMTSGDEEVAAQVVAPLPPRFSDKLYQYVDARVNIVLSSMSCDDVIKMSDDDINRLARCIIEEYVIGDPLGFDCAVLTLRFYRKWFENRVLREKEAREKEAREKESREKEAREKESKEEKSREKESREKESKEKEPREKDSKEKGLKKRI